MEIKNEEQFMKFLKDYMTQHNIGFITPTIAMADENQQWEDEVWIINYNVEAILDEAIARGAKCNLNGDFYNISEYENDAGNITIKLEDGPVDEDEEEYEFEAFYGFEYYAYPNGIRYLQSCYDFLNNLIWE